VAYDLVIKITNYLETKCLVEDDGGDLDAIPNIACLESRRLISMMWILSWMIVRVWWILRRMATSCY